MHGKAPRALAGAGNIDETEGKIQRESCQQHKDCSTEIGRRRARRRQRTASIASVSVQVRLTRIRGWRGSRETTGKGMKTMGAALARRRGGADTMVVGGTNPR